MSIVIPAWIVSTLCYSALTIAIIAIVGFLIWALWRSVKGWLYLNNYFWFCRMYISLVVKGKGLNDETVNEFMTKTIHDWAKGDTERLIKLQRVMGILIDTIPENEKELLAK